MGQAVKPHDRLTGGTLVALSKAAFPPSDGIINVDFIQALIGVCQRILDHYFLHISGHKAASLNEEILVNNRHKFISLMDDGAEDSTRLNHAAALLAQLDTRQVQLTLTMSTRPVTSTRISASKHSRPSSKRWAKPSTTT